LRRLQREAPVSNGKREREREREGGRMFIKAMRGDEMPRL
jgi:hypothetical protein